MKTSKVLAAATLALNVAVGTSNSFGDGAVNATPLAPWQVPARVSAPNETIHNLVYSFDQCGSGIETIPVRYDLETTGLHQVERTSLCDLPGKVPALLCRLIFAESCKSDFARPGAQPRLRQVTTYSL